MKNYPQTIKKKELGKLIKLAQQLSPQVFNFDTLYILQNYEILTDTYYGRIWNENNNVLNYEYHDNSMKKLSNEIFSKSVIDNIKIWNLEKIRQEEKINFNRLKPDDKIISIRLICQNNIIKSEKIIFRPF